ncbi:MAG: hypothetical protein E3K36_06440 [Candidatus Brocadia sp.]|nr:hypothetical protein [Candidatus Brocadia sp.]
MNNIGNIKQIYKNIGNIALTWFALIRLPNLFTIPGDILVGYLIAMPLGENPNAYIIFTIMVISLALYIFGILLNDFFDVNIDRIERPNRPLVSGKIKRNTALIVAICIGMFALIIAAFVGKNTLALVSLLALLVFFYNFLAKHIPGIGFIILGLCRGMNIFLGASVFIPNVPSRIWSMTIVEVCYITAISLAAYHEADRAPQGIVRWLPPIILIIGFTVMLVQNGIHWIAMAGIMVAISSVFMGSFSMRINLQSSFMQEAIGNFIRSLIPIQVAFILLCLPESLVFIVMLYVLWPLSKITGRKFAGS